MANLVQNYKCVAVNNNKPVRLRSTPDYTIDTNIIFGIPVGDVVTYDTTAATTPYSAEILDKWIPVTCYSGAYKGWVYKAYFEATDESATIAPHNSNNNTNNNTNDNTQDTTNNDNTYNDDTLNNDVSGKSSKGWMVGGLVSLAAGLGAFLFL